MRTKQKEPTSKFIPIKCEKCKNEQTIFNKASTHVTCLVCGEILANPRGGNIRFIKKKEDNK